MRNVIWILLVVAVFEVAQSRRRENHHHREHHHHRPRNRGALREYSHKYHHANNEFGKRLRDVDGSLDSTKRSGRHGYSFTAGKGGKKRIVEIDIGEKKTGRGKIPFNAVPIAQRHHTTVNSTGRSFTTAHPATTTGRTTTTEAPEVTIPCLSSKDCKPGSCCQNRNGKERVCMELNVPSGKQCWNYCMCSKGLVCFYKQGTDVDQKDKTGICKIAQEGDLSRGNYMKT